MFAKYIKCGYLGILPVLAELSFRWAFGDSPVLDNLADKHYRLDFIVLLKDYIRVLECL